MANETRATKDEMVSVLVKDLHSNVQLPQCLKIISYLRRVERFSDTQLKFKFLNVRRFAFESVAHVAHTRLIPSVFLSHILGQARDAYMQSLLREIPNTTPLVHLAKLIETYRVNLFDIATQYKALFPPEDNITAIAMKNYGGVTLRTAPPSAEYRDHTDATILSSWLHYQVTNAAN